MVQLLWSSIFTKVLVKKGTCSSVAQVVLTKSSAFFHSRPPLQLTTASFYNHHDFPNWQIFWLALNSREGEKYVSPRDLAKNTTNKILSQPRWWWSELEVAAENTSQELLALLRVFSLPNPKSESSSRSNRGQRGRTPSMNSRLQQ